MLNNRHANQQIRPSLHSFNWYSVVQIKIIFKSLIKPSFWLSCKFDIRHKRGWRTFAHEKVCPLNFFWPFGLFPTGLFLLIGRLPARQLPNELLITVVLLTELLFKSVGKSPVGKSLIKMVQWNQVWEISTRNLNWP